MVNMGVSKGFEGGIIQGILVRIETLYGFAQKYT